MLDLPPQDTMSCWRSNAFSATSDRMSRLQLLAFAGLVAGLVVGVALAALRGTAVMRRSTAE